MKRFLRAFVKTGYGASSRQIPGLRRTAFQASRAGCSAIPPRLSDKAREQRCRPALQQILALHQSLAMPANGSIGHAGRPAWPSWPHYQHQPNTGSLARYISVGAGQTATAAGIQGAGIGLGSSKGQASSTSTAGISGIAGDTAAITGQASTGLSPLFDADKVQREINAQVVITQAFSQEAPKAVASYAASQSNALRAQASNEPDAAKKAELQAQAKDWDEGGVYRIALHTAAGALGGGLSGAAGAAASASAPPTS